MPSFLCVPLHPLLYSTSICYFSSPLCLCLPSPSVTPCRVFLSSVISHYLQHPKRSNYTLVPPYTSEPSLPLSQTISHPRHPLAQCHATLKFLPFFPLPLPPAHVSGASHTVAFHPSPSFPFSVNNKDRPAFSSAYKREYQITGVRVIRPVLNIRRYHLVYLLSCTSQREHGLDILVKEINGTQ